MVKKMVINSMVTGMTVATLVGFSSGVYAEKIQNVKVNVNGHAILMDEAPAYVDTNSQQTYVPLLSVSDDLGAEVDWTTDDKPISVTVDVPEHHEVLLHLNDQKAVVDGKALQLDGTPVLENGAIMVPLNLISKGLGADVKLTRSAEGVVTVDIVMAGE